MTKQNIWPLCIILLFVALVRSILYHFAFPKVETVEVEKMTEQEQVLAHIEQLNIAILWSDIIKTRFQKEKKELYDQLEKYGSLTDRSKNPEAYLFVSCGDSTDPTECTNIGKHEVVEDTWVVSEDHIIDLDADVRDTSKFAIPRTEE